MKTKTRFSAALSEIPMSSMIDVVFLLLVYFLIIFKPLAEETLIKTDLPLPSPAKAFTSVPFVINVIEIYEDDLKKDLDYYVIGGRLWESDNLHSLLEEISKSDPEANIIINCGPNARHRKLIKLLDMCNDVGLGNLNIINDGSIEFQPAYR